MNFTREEACEQIAAELTNGGKTHLSMSERSVAEVVGALMPLAEAGEWELGKFLEVAKPLCETMNNNHKKDVADRLKELGLGKPKHTEPTTEGDELAKAESDGEIQRRLTALEAKIEAGERKIALDAKRSEIAERLKVGGVKDADWISGMLAEVDVKADADAEECAQRLVKLYNRGRAKPALNATPKSAGGQGSENPLSAVSEYMRKLRESKGAN